MLVLSENYDNFISFAKQGVSVSEQIEILDQRHAHDEVSYWQDCILTIQIAEARTVAVCFRVMAMIRQKKQTLISF